MSDPGDPITELAASAAAAHELFIAYVGAGFTESQAMVLVTQIVLVSTKNAAG